MPANPVRSIDELDPTTRAMVNRMKEQLLIVFMRRIMRARGHDTGALVVPVHEVDDTGSFVFTFEVDETARRFKFVLSKKN